MSLASQDGDRHQDEDAHGRAAAMIHSMGEAGSRRGRACHPGRAAEARSDAVALLDGRHGKCHGWGWHRSWRQCQAVDPAGLRLEITPRLHLKKAGAADN